MNHLIICPEYPPAEFAGGIGTYVRNISRLLVERGETVHIVSRRWRKAPKHIEIRHNGKLVIHRVGISGGRADQFSSPSNEALVMKGLLNSSFPPQGFAYQTALLSEKLIREEGIDLIESQEFEAPLYYLQLRRALGLGPENRPPCIIHLHSPMEFIVRHNDWDIHHPYFRTAKRLEDYSILAADARLCPSRYLARQAEAHYGLEAGAIHVIPLPISERPLIEKAKNICESGCILYMGRLEKRKGVVEWIEAAVQSARQDKSVNFEFVGANCLGTSKMSGEEVVARLIPDDVKKRFHFRGEQKFADMSGFLSGARVAVVPSRWENFPNACAEAMFAGLPVIATREGGTAEMIEDGRSGWLARNPDKNGLYEALLRALKTPPVEMAEMGRTASEAIRKMCDPQKIVQDHLAFRRRVTAQNASPSLRLLQNSPWALEKTSPATARRTSAKNFTHGLAIVISCYNAGDYLDECLKSLGEQTRKPATVIIVDDGSTSEETLKAFRRARRQGWKIIKRPTSQLESTRNFGVQFILDSGLTPIGISFLSALDLLEPGFVEICESVLMQCPEVALVSGWVYYLEPRKGVCIRPCPGFPYQWAANELADFSAVRTEALIEVGGFRTGMDYSYEIWDLFNAVLVGGWTGITFPGLLGRCRFGKNLVYPASMLNLERRLRSKILERFPDLVSRHARDIVLLTEANAGRLLHAQYFSVPERVSRLVDRLFVRARMWSRIFRH